MAKRITKYTLLLMIGAVSIYFIAFVISHFLVSERGEKAFFTQRQGENTPLVFAHQGGEAIRPTNTMIAFRDSVVIGADVLDADMHMSSDGVLVLAHDETVDRTSNGTGEIRNMTIAELRALDFGHNFTTDDGQTYPYRGEGHGIVTVRELFDEFADVRFGIEIKQTTSEAAEKLCGLITEFGYEEDMLISSFAQDNMDIFRENCPNVATSATEDEARQYYIYQLVRLPGFYSPPFDALQVPEYLGERQILTGNFVATAKRQNLPIVPWTINEESDFERLIRDFDVTGINTNYPDRLVEYLQTN